jgi:hypothetical protein
MSQILSEVFWAMVVSTLAGLIIAVGKMCYKSKCSTIDLCCLRIVRNIEAEVKEDLEAPKSDDSKKESNL